MITNIEAKEIRKKIYRTAFYLRLSRDDGDKAESDSIANQRKLVMDFARGKSEFCVVDEYVDDGYSGSNFDRPAWKRLYADLECGAVNCVIVKDLSRFGRNYIEVGRYLQNVFPLMGVRLVAVNDNYDSLNDWQDGDALIVPMKNLINDIYCRDISTKITTQLAAMRKRGECVAPFAPYGYRKDPDDHAKLIPDEEAAATVKQIFLWKLDGLSNRLIADRLNEQGVPSPYEYRNSKGERVSGAFRRHEKSRWTGGSVYTILHNESYIGTMVQGKWRRPNYRSKDRVLLPKDEWTRVEGTHEPIVDKELYSIVQEIMEKETRIAGGGDKVNLFSGFLFCAECGSQLTQQPSTYKGKTYRYYTCRCCMGEGKKPCRISENKAYAAVLDAVRNTAAAAVSVEKLMKEADGIPEQSRAVTRLDGQIVHLQEELERYAKLKGGLYEDYSAGILSREEYMEYSQMYKRKIEETKTSLRTVADERRAALDDYREAKWIKTFKKYRNLTSLERSILAELVDKVLVYIGGEMEIVLRDENSIEGTLEAYRYEGSDEDDETL